MKQCPDGPVALGVLQANRKSGKERLHDDGTDLGCDLLSFLAVERLRSRQQCDTWGARGIYRGKSAGYSGGHEGAK